jgi:hypothetical protein
MFLILLGENLQELLHFFEGGVICIKAMANRKESTVANNQTYYEDY